MICEKCTKNHDGSYGSGRFCSSRCARSYSTADKRKIINNTVSIKLKGWKTNPHIWTDDDRIRAKKVVTHNKITRILEEPFENLSKYRRRIRLLLEQNNLCAICECEQFWNNKPLIFHCDHIKGKQAGEKRDNLRMICPNCHSQTPTYCAKNITEKGREAMRLAGKRQSHNFQEGRKRSQARIAQLRDASALEAKK